MGAPLFSENVTFTASCSMLSACSFLRRVCVCVRVCLSAVCFSASLSLFVSRLSELRAHSNLKFWFYVSLSSSTNLSRLSFDKLRACQNLEFGIWQALSLSSIEFIALTSSELVKASEQLLSLSNHGLELWQAQSLSKCWSRAELGRVLLWRWQALSLSKHTKPWLMLIWQAQSLSNAQSSELRTQNSELRTQNSDFWNYGENLIGIYIWRAR